MTEISDEAMETRDVASMFKQQKSAQEASDSHGANVSHGENGIETDETLTWSRDECREKGFDPTCDSTPPWARDARVSSENLEDLDDLFEEELVCRNCGVRFPKWAIEAHSRYHSEVEM